MTASKNYDAIILGSGPAGLSTALGLARVHRTCAVISNSQYRNARSHAAHAILTRDHTDPEEIRRIGREQIERYGNTDFIEGKITKVKKEVGDNYEFVVEEDADKGGRRWKGRTLVFATGCRDIFPDLAGYVENWGENIYQCLFCDGHERSHLPSGVLAYPILDPMTIKLLTTAHFISLPPDRAHAMPPSGKGSETSPPKSKVTFFTNGPLSPSDESSHAGALEICAAYGITVDQRRVLKLVADDKEGVHIHLANDICAGKTPDSTSSIHLGWIAHKPPTEPSVPNLISQSGLEIPNSPFGSYLTATPPFNSTSMPGVFACGDTGVVMTHVTVAMSTGIACAAGVLDWCNQKDNQIALEIWRGRDKRNIVMKLREEEAGTAVDGTGCSVEDGRT